MKTFIIPLLLFIFFFLFTLSISTRPDPHTDNKKGGGDDGNGFYGPGSGSGFNIPGFGSNWPGSGVGGGYGSGYGGPKGGHSKSGVIKPSIVCKDKGPCYKKKLTCPVKCFTSYSHSGKGYGGGGGGGGCTMDCKKCVAYC